jgi:hypothetical protein
MIYIILEERHMKFRGAHRGTNRDRTVMVDPVLQ